MAETLLSLGVLKLWDLLVRETHRFKEVDGQLTELKSDLNLLRSFLKDADAKKHASALVRNCLEEIKEIVFDTEDIIETFLLKEELRKTSGIKKRMRRLSCIVVDGREVASEMGGISKRISKVIRDMQSFGVQQMIVDGSVYSHPLQGRQREMRHTFSSDNESDFVGLEQNVKKLVGYLVEEDSSQVVSITGMGGLGKTTLAREVFNHETVKSHFTGFAWVCVSQQFTSEYVWQTILWKLMPEYKALEMTKDELQEKLFRVLETQKALIVLDDIWREEDWDIIKPMFPRGKGWKLLLTSRNDGVPLRADPKCFTFKPVCLTLEESWTLFRRIALPRENTTEYKVDEEMEEMGKQMIKHCGGLPLAIKVLGGLLAAQYTLHEWKRVYENINSHIVGGTSFNYKNISSVYHVLYLSFEELPIYLKHCFLYLAHFPEDYEIDVRKLSYYWAAEGIPKPEYYERASTRDVADVYIQELVKRNMVMSERDMLTSRFETCHLHDVMREVCLFKAKEENFLQIIHGTSTAHSKSRRLVVHRLDETYHPKGEMKNPKLRSLLLFCWVEGWMPSNLFFTRLQLLRVLQLCGPSFVSKGGKLPSSIGKLIHLRYLSLWQTHATRLPSSMRNLKLLLYLNLQVDARCVLYIPNFLKEMRELTYLSFPWRIDTKVKLELGNLVNMETLKNFPTEHVSVMDLQCMTRLKALSICIQGEECNMEALSSSLSELSHLENLTISYLYGVAPKNDEERFVLDCVHLKQLELRIHMPKLPDEQHFSSHLTTISLTGCRLEEDPMPILEKLLHLYKVSLLNNSFCGRKMVCSGGGFPRLRNLLFFVLEELEEWIVEEDSMPLLHSVSIRHCQMLKELPDGMRFVTSLRALVIGTIEREFKEKLSKGGDDYYKIQHIPLLKIFLESPI